MYIYMYIYTSICMYVYCANTNKLYYLLFYNFTSTSIL